MERSLIALELRRMQMLSEIGMDNNTTIVLLPSEFSKTAKSFTGVGGKERKVRENTCHSITKHRKTTWFSYALL